MTPAERHFRHFLVGKIDDQQIHLRHVGDSIEARLGRDRVVFFNGRRAVLFRPLPRELRGGELGIVERFLKEQQTCANNL